MEKTSWTKKCKKNLQRLKIKLWKTIGTKNIFNPKYTERNSHIVIALKSFILVNQSRQSESIDG
jgi:hypothetical protein